MHFRQISVALAFLAACAVTAGASDKTHTVTTHTHTMVKTDSKLAAEAKITMAEARKIAMAQVPLAKVRSGELEREHGRLIYSFDMKTPGKRGIDEVNIDALDGSIVNKMHEGAKAEHKEMMQDKAEAVKDTMKH